MSKVLVTESYLTNIANAIRDKSGDSGATFRPAEMADAILNLSAGGGEGGGADFPTEITLPAGGDNWNSGGMWDWLLELGYPLKVFDNSMGYWNEIMMGSQLVDGSHLELVVQPGARSYQNCSNLQYLPKHYAQWEASSNQNQLFSGCRNLKEIDYDFFALKDSDGNPKGGYWGGGGTTTSSRRAVFKYCSSLRALPYIKHLKYSSSSGGGTYDGMFTDCFALNEIRDFPVTQYLINSDTFSNTFDNCHHLKSLTFAMTDDDMALEADWSGIVIDLTVGVGYASTGAASMTGYSSGLSGETEVDSVTTYNKNKNNEDWWSTELRYSRYNHDSAVETLNSLPDAAEYLDANAGSPNNTIKFLRSSGASTDGGSINNLTEAEIAVAAAKGWTVTLV